MVSPGAAFADAKLSESAVGQVSQIETRLFCQSFPQEATVRRLERIEKRVFGVAMTGSVMERIERLKSLDVLKKPTVTEPQPVSKAVDERLAPVAAHTTGSMQPSDEDCAVERARVAVLAAREEEIGKLLANGVSLWRANRAQEAAAKFEEVIRLSPDNADAHYSLGIIEEAQGGLIEALSNYQAALSSRPGKNEYREAVEIVEKKLKARELIQDRKSEVRQLAEDAIFAYKRGELLSALDLYRRLDEKSPNQALIKYNIGTIYLMMRVPEQALVYFRQACALNSGEARFRKACSQLEAVMSAHKTTGIETGVDPAGSRRHHSKNPMREYLGILARGSGNGCFVTTVITPSRALQAGLQTGDVICALQGQVVRKPEDINRLLLNKAPQEAVFMVVERDHRRFQVTL